jgi:hypothetical protein
MAFPAWPTLGKPTVGDRCIRRRITRSVVRCAPVILGVWLESALETAMIVPVPSRACLRS